jgi:ubiquinone/menaquinone biosynthesis C-methylase UbiE
LPFPDESFDTVISGLVLCTIPDPRRALGEMRRVLRPGGTLRFYEHVRSEDPKLARWQDRVSRPWSWVAGGCRVNQDTVSMIPAAGFRIETLDRFDFEAAPRLSRPHVIGVAAPA